VATHKKTQNIVCHNKSWGCVWKDFVRSWPPTTTRALRGTFLSMLWVIVTRICNLWMKTPGIHGPPITLQQHQGDCLWGNSWTFSPLVPSYHSAIYPVLFYLRAQIFNIWLLPNYLRKSVDFCFRKCLLPNNYIPYYYTIFLCKF
jgi:hypothetical protein